MQEARRKMKGENYQTILHLQAIRKTVCNHRQSMAALLTMDLSEISLVEKEERCLITVEIDKETSFEKEVELITAETAKYQPVFYKSLYFVYGYIQLPQQQNSFKNRALAIVIIAITIFGMDKGRL